MKILIVNDYGVIAGGAERIAVDLRDGLRARGHEVRLFTSIASPVPLPIVADDTCFGTNGWARLLLQMANPWAMRRLGAVLRTFRPEMVHVRMFLTQLSPAILPSLSDFLVLYHVGNQQAICPLNTRTLPDGTPCTFRAGTPCYQQGCVSAAGLARTVVQFASWRRYQQVFRRIVANSEALAAELRSNGVAVTGVVRNGTRIVSARPRLTTPPTVAYAGRLVERKGVDTLLSAMTTVCRRVPDARLLIVGDGPDRARIETLVRTASFKRAVTMCGHLARPELDERLGSAWVQVVPSRVSEPAANVIPEAMMRGTAVVGTEVGGTPELVHAGVTGFLIPPRDPAALADRLIALLENRDLAERFGRSARSVALAELTTDVMLDRFEAIYQELLTRRRGAVGRSEPV